MTTVVNYAFKLSRRSYIILSLLYMGFIYFLSSLSLPFNDNKYPNILSFFISMLHFPLYMILGFTLLLSFRLGSSKNCFKSTPFRIYSSMFILICYGAFDEFHQSWTGRTASLFDFLTNICGGLFSLYTINYFMSDTTIERHFYAKSLILIFLSSLFSLVVIYYSCYFIVIGWDSLSSVSDTLFFYICHIHRDNQTSGRIEKCVFPK